MSVQEPSIPLLVLVLLKITGSKLPQVAFSDAL